MAEIEKPGKHSPLFSTPETHPKKESAVTKPNPEFAEREAEFAAREERLKKREAEIAHDANVSFSEGLVQDGKLLPANKGKLVAVSYTHLDVYKRQGGTTCPVIFGSVA